MIKFAMWARSCIDRNGHKAAQLSKIQHTAVKHNGAAYITLNVIYLKYGLNSRVVIISSIQN